MSCNKIPIQETYGDRFQNCWGCGAKNKDGLHLHTYPSEDGSECVSQFLPDEKYSGGVHGSIIETRDLSLIRIPL